MNTAAIYLRVSTRHQAEDGFSLDDQRTTLTALAASRGWETTIYEDAGLSGESIEGRPGMVALLAAVARSEHHALLVVDESRLAREDLPAAIIRDRLRRASVTLVTPSGDRDLTDPAAVLVATILGANHAFEQKLRTAKTTAGLRSTARAGYWPGDPAPYGFRLTPDPDGTRHKVLTIVDNEAQLIRDAADMILDHGHTTWTAARTLNASGRLTRSGTPWHFRNLAFQLQKPHHTGTYTYNSSDGPITMGIPTILEQGRWDALQALIRRTPAAEAPQQVLSPLRLPPLRLRRLPLRRLPQRPRHPLLQMLPNSRPPRASRPLPPLPPPHRCRHPRNHRLDRGTQPAHQP